MLIRFHAGTRDAIRSEQTFREITGRRSREWKDASDADLAAWETDAVARIETIVTRYET
jgi:hypothetical protein